jgi:hypothetical protein
MINNNKKILLVTYSSPAKLARVGRNLNFLLSEGYSVDVLCTSEFTWPGINHVYHFALPNSSLGARIIRKLCLLARSILPFAAIQHAFSNYMLKHLSVLTDLAKNYDILFVEHVDFLRQVVHCKRSHAKIVFDVKDYYPREFESNLLFRLLEAPYRRLVFCQNLKHIHALLSVSGGLARLLEEEYGFKSTLILSAPPKVDNSPSKIDPNFIKCVHHGSANADRGLEKLIGCSGFTSIIPLDLYLVGNKKELELIARQASHNPSVQLRPPVPLTELLPTLAQYDIGIIFFPSDKSTNLKHCLPNKFFEYVQARLMIITTPLPDIADLVRKYNLGIVLDSFSIEDLESCLKSLSSEQIMIHKFASHAAAEELCFENESLKLKSIMKSL